VTKIITIKLIGVLLCTVCVAFQPPKIGGPAQSPAITAARVAKSDQNLFGPVYVTIAGEERKIADGGFDVWIIEHGRRVVYSGREGSGGFENEGQSLHVYDARADTQRKIMSEYYLVIKVTEVSTSGKKTALLVKMEDGGLGASYFAVVDPDRGEVFFRRWARLGSRQGDVIVLDFYKEKDWEKLNEGTKSKVLPYKRERYNLNVILKGSVISNKQEP